MKKSKLILTLSLSALLVTSLIFTGCPQAPEPENPNTETPGTQTPDSSNSDTSNTDTSGEKDKTEEKKYPETLSEADKERINADITEADLDGVIDQISEIITVLDSQSGDEAAGYKATFSNMRTAVYGNVTRSNYQKEGLKTFGNVDLGERKKNNSYSNYNDYLELYEAWSEAFAKFKETRAKYYKAYREYDANYDKMEAYNELVEYLKTAVKDFQDDFKLSESYTDTEDKVQAISDENDFRAGVKENYDKVSGQVNTDYLNTALAYNAIVVDFSFVKSNGGGNVSASDSRDPVSTIPGVDPNPSETPDEPIDPPAPPAPTMIEYTVGDTIDPSDFYDETNHKLTKDVKLIVPEEVYAVDFYDAYMALHERVGDFDSILEYESSNKLAGTTFKGGLEINKLKTVKNVIFGDIEAKITDDNVKGNSLPIFKVSTWGDKAEDRNVYDTGTCFLT